MQFFSALSLLALIAMIVSLFSRKTRRHWWKAGIACIITFWVQTGIDSEAAQAAGFNDLGEMIDANRAGFNDPAEWRAELLARQAAAEKAAEQERLEEEQQRLAVLAEEEAEKRKGFHCLSAWDGSHRGVVKGVTAQLRDPDSFEHITTVVTTMDANGRHSLLMDYRARNGFGGMNVSRAKAYFDNDSCQAVVLAYELP